MGVCQPEETFYQGMQESLTISTYCISIIKRAYPVLVSACVDSEGVRVLHILALQQINTIKLYFSPPPLSPPSLGICLC